VRGIEREREREIENERERERERETHKKIRENEKREETLAQCPHVEIIE
jgi:hypothetical protein